MEALTGSNCDQQKFRETKSLVRFFDVLSTNKDRNGLEFISTIEGTLPNWSLNGICYYLHRIVPAGLFLLHTQKTSNWKT